MIKKEYILSMYKDHVCLARLLRQYAPGGT